MTFLDRASPVATAGLTPATEDIETTTGELVGIGFQREALERNYWEARQRRAKDQRDRTLGDISEAVYGARDGWKAPPQDVPQDQGPQTIGSAMRAGEAAVAEDSATLDQLFKDLEALRAVDPGTFANFPGSVADLDSSIEAQVSQEMRAELEELEARTDNRSSPSVLGGAAEFTGMAGAAISDVEGLVTLPFGAGSGSLGRSVLIEGLLGAGSEALALPAYNAQAEFLGRDAPDPLTLLLFGASFGAALPVAGRALRDGSGLAVKGARVSNQALLAGARKLTGNDKVRAAATAVAREEAALDSAPAGIDADLHANAMDQAGVLLESGAPVVVRPAIEIDDPQNWPSIQAGIFAGESGGDYDALFGFSNRSGGPFSNVRVTEMTVDQAIAFSQPRGQYGQWVKGKIGRVATPMGAYQVVGTTLRAAKSGLGLSGSEPFDAATQDLIGKWILRQQGTDAWEGYRGPRTPGSGRSDGPTAFVDFGGPDGTGISGRSAVYDGATFSADDNGFEITAGDVSFAQPWVQTAFDFEAPGPARIADAPTVTRDDIVARLQGYQDARRAFDDLDINTSVADRRAADDAVTSAYARLKALTGLPDDIDAGQLDPEQRTQLERVTSAPGELANEIDRGRSVADLQDGDAVASLVEGVPASVRQTQSETASTPAANDGWVIVDRQTSEAVLETRDPRKVQALRPEYAAVPTREYLETFNARVKAEGGVQPPQQPWEPAPNQPNVGTDTRTPALFDDPVESAGVAAQVDLAERDVRAFATRSDTAELIFPTGGEDSPGLRVSDIFQDIDDEAEFLEQLQICMPKGVANG